MEMEMVMEMEMGMADGRLWLLRTLRLVPWSLGCRFVLEGDALRSGRHRPRRNNPLAMQQQPLLTCDSSRQYHQQPPPFPASANCTFLRNALPRSRLLALQRRSSYLLPRPRPTLRGSASAQRGLPGCVGSRPHRRVIILSIVEHVVAAALLPLRLTRFTSCRLLSALTAAFVKCEISQAWLASSSSCSIRWLLSMTGSNRRL